MRRTKGTGCITQMSAGRYKYRGLIRVGVNKNENPKNKIFYGNTKREVENTTALIPKYGIGYNRCNALCELGNCKDCECKKLFASNRQKGVVTVEDFINRNFHNKKNSVSKEFQRLTDDEFYKEYL